MPTWAPQGLENSALAAARVRLALLDHVAQSPKFGFQMDASWNHLEFGSGQKGVPGGVQKKGQNSKGLRVILRGNVGVPGEGGEG